MARFQQRRRLQGTIAPGGPDWVYVPVEVPPGVGELAVRYRYDRPATPPGVPGNVLDIGIFDERGTGPGGGPGGSGGPPGWSPGGPGGSGGPPGWSPGGSEARTASLLLVPPRSMPR